MDTGSQTSYEQIKNGGTGVYEQKRGLIAVWGKEAVQFLDGLISNDVKTLESGGQMLAAFPNAQGRLLAVVRVLRQDDRFLFETEEATRDKVFQNLFRFTFAGDFFVEDLSDSHRFFAVFGPAALREDIGFRFLDSGGARTLVLPGDAAPLSSDLVTISDELYETLRIEAGTPRYGVDMDETTIVPELPLEEMISYKKGCYIGQEIIARIYFRGHVAKKLTGLVFTEGVKGAEIAHGSELASVDGKNAGRITSVTFSPRLGRTIALGYVRYDYLAEGTELLVGDKKAGVHALPFDNIAQ